MEPLSQQNLDIQERCQKLTELPMQKDNGWDAEMVWQKAHEVADILHIEPEQGLVFIERCIPNRLARND